MSPSPDRHLPAFEGEDDSEQDDDEHEDPCDHSGHLHGAVHLLLRLHGIRVLSGSTYTHTHTHTHTHIQVCNIVTLVGSNSQRAKLHTITNEHTCPCTVRQWTDTQVRSRSHACVHICCTYIHTHTHTHNTMGMLYPCLPSMDNTLSLAYRHTHTTWVSYNQHFYPKVKIN